MEVFRKGYIVAAILGILTVGEYIAAAEIHGDLARFLALTVGTVFEAWLIAWYYMHIYRLWRRGEAH